MNVRPVLTSCRTAWRCENVPRSRVLAGDPDRDAVDEQRRERERLRLAPVDAALVDRVAAALELLHQLRVRREALGDAQQLLVQLAQPLGGDRRDDGVAGRGGNAPLADGLRVIAAEGLLQRLVRALQLRLHLGGELVRPLLRDDAALDELRRVLLAHGRVLGDRGREQRLRVRRLVLLVVAVAAVADEIDDDVVAEAPPVREREPDGRDRRFRIVGVDVDDGNVEALREVARVARRAAALGIGGEADLVVRDQVQRAAGRVAVERLEVQRLRHLALAGERRVAVDQHRERDGRVVVAGAGRAVGLLGAGAALDDRVDRLEMARVRRRA